MGEYLGSPKHAAEGRNGGDSRNGTRSERMIVGIAPIEFDVPRDRGYSFDPQTVPKNQLRLDGVESMVISVFSSAVHDRRCFFSLTSSPSRDQSDHPPKQISETKPSHTHLKSDEPLQQSLT